MITKSYAITEVIKLKQKYPNHQADDKELTSFIDDTICIWNNCQSFKENWNVLQAVSSKYDNPSGKSDIQTKLYIINNLYNTRVTDPKTLIKIAEIISNKRLNFFNISDTLNEYNTIIHECKKKLNYRPFSLLSKYYAVMNPTYFPIKDSFAIKSLNRFKPKPSLKSETPYSEYIEAIDTFIKDHKLTLNYRELDKFLWLYGQA